MTEIVFKEDLVFDTTADIKFGDKQINSSVSRVYNSTWNQTNPISIGDPVAVKPNGDLILASIENNFEDFITNSGANYVGSVTPDGTNIQRVRLSALSDTKYVLAILGGNARVYCTVYDASIPTATPVIQADYVEFSTSNNNWSYSFDVMGVSETQFVVSFYDQINAQTDIVVGNISGSTITAETATKLSIPEYTHRLHKISSNTFMISYLSGVDLRVREFTITGGNTVSLDATEYVLSSYNHTVDVYNRVDKIPGTNNILHTSTAAGGIISSNIIETDGTNITNVGAPQLLQNNPSDTVIRAFDHAFTLDGKIVYATSTSSYPLRSWSGVISGTSITFASPTDINPSIVNAFVGYGFFIDKYSDGKMIVRFIERQYNYYVRYEEVVISDTDGDGLWTRDSFYAFIINNGGTTPNGGMYIEPNESGNEIMGLFVQSTPRVYMWEFASYEYPNNDSLIGIAKNSAANGEELIVGTKGSIVTTNSTFVPGSKYYCQSNGSITTDTSNVYIGQALSTTDILVKK